MPSGRPTATALLLALILFGENTAAWAQGNWAGRASMPTPRNGAATGVLDGRLFVAGGSMASTVEAYDPASNTWASKAYIPTSRSMAASGVISGKLYVVGGCIHSDCAGGFTGVVEAYDPADDTWSNKASLPTPRFGSVAGAIGGKLYVVGGAGACGACVSLNTLEIYDPATDQWTTGTPMPTSRAEMGGAVIDGKLYVVGGFNRAIAGGPSTDLAVLEVYDPATDSWATKSPMPTPRLALGGAALNGLLYAVAGYHSAYLKTVEAYAPVTDSWTAVASIPTARYAPSPQSINGVLYVAGSGSSGPSDVLESFVPDAVVGACGDGMVGVAEQCDDGDTIFATGDPCTADCLNVRCGNPTNHSGDLPTASDALFILRAAVGQKACDLRVCDVDASGLVLTSDALRVLRRAVGQDAALGCWDPAIGAHCKDPGTPLNGTRGGTVLTQGGVLTFACDSCFSIAGSTDRTCQATGSWSGVQPTCSVIDCGNPGTPSHGAKQGTLHTCGSSVSYTCSEGYTLVGDASRACGEGGTWSGSLPDCVFGLPAPPSELSASVVTPTRIDLGWKDHSSDETGFEIERKVGDGGLYLSLITVAADSVAYQDLTASAFTSYFYRVRAVNAAGTSAYSNEEKATTGGQCKSTNGLCSSGIECCSTVCSAGQCCMGQGGSCVFDTDCCLGSCSGSLCGCKPGGSACTNDLQCCGGVHCLGGLCGCRAIGAQCNLAGECCSNRCSGGVCCRVSCQVDSDCCSNSCVGFTCQ